MDKGYISAKQLNPPAKRKRRLAPWPVSPILLAAIACFLTMHIPSHADETTSTPAQVETTSTPVQIETASTPAQVETTNTPGQVETTSTPGQVETTSTPAPGETSSTPGQIEPLTGDVEEFRNIRELSSRLPAFMQPALANVIQRRAPILVFRRWAHSPKPFAQTFLFCVFVGLLGAAFLPKQIAIAQECCRRQFWRCIGRAILVGVILVLSIRVLHVVGITEPLAMLVIAVLELGIIFGLSVGVSLIGERLAAKTRLAGLTYFNTHPRLLALAKIFLGSLSVALIMQIPGIGLLPGIGIRIAMLIAILGAGGLLNTRFGTRSLSSE